VERTKGKPKLSAGNFGITVSKIFDVVMGKQTEPIAFIQRKKRRGQGTMRKQDENGSQGRNFQLFKKLKAEEAQPSR